MFPQAVTGESRNLLLISCFLQRPIPLGIDLDLWYHRIA